MLHKTREILPTYLLGEQEFNTQMFQHNAR